MASAAQMSAAAPKALPRQLRTGASFKAARAPARRVAVRASASAGETDEIVLLEKMLKLAKERKEAEAAAPVAGASPAEGYDGKGFTSRPTPSPRRSGQVPQGQVRGFRDESALPDPPRASCPPAQGAADHAPPLAASRRARDNNIPSRSAGAASVFATPGERQRREGVAGPAVASRGSSRQLPRNILINKEEGATTTRSPSASRRTKPVRRRVTGKTIGVIGLAPSAPWCRLRSARHEGCWLDLLAGRRCSSRDRKGHRADDLFAQSDYITVHVPYIKGVTHHLINADALSKCKPGVHLLNFARGEIIDGAAVKNGYDSGMLTGKYMSDFSDPDLMGHPRHIVMPHLGASTEEAEENSAAMAATTMMDFLETGTIRNSVNFHTTILAPQKNSSGARLCIVNRNEPGALGEITTFLGSKGLNISQQINTSRGDIAYTVIDFSNQPDDGEALQQELAEACSYIISLRFLGMVFDDALGEPGTYFYVSWAQ